MRRYQGSYRKKPKAWWPCFVLQVGAVVVGFDRHINYFKIQTAQLCIDENPGCLFIATNLDAKTHLTDAQEWAGNGAMVGAIQGQSVFQSYIWTHLHWRMQLGKGKLSTYFSPVDDWRLFWREDFFRTSAWCSHKLVKQICWRTCPLIVLFRFIPAVRQ